MERFTLQARATLRVAQEEAERMQRSQVGIEHLLLALLRDESGTAGRILRALALEAARLEALAVDLSPQRKADARLDLAQATKRTLELAVGEARRLGQRAIGPEHLLLGLSRTQAGQDLLRQMNIDPEAVYNQVQRNLQANSSQLDRSDARSERSSTEQAPPPTPPRQTPLLDQLTSDLTALAREDKLDPVVERQNEIERLVGILCRRKDNNAILIGEPGVGKTALVEGLARRIADGTVPDRLRGHSIRRLDIGYLAHLSQFPGSFSFDERLLRLIQDLRLSSSMLFIADLRFIVGLQIPNFRLNLELLLRSALDKHDFACIGEMTIRDFDAWQEADPVLARRFQPIYVKELTIEASIQALQSGKQRYEAYHHVKITDAALESAVRLSAKHMTDRRLPGKAFDLLDEAASRLGGKVADSARNDLVGNEAQLIAGETTEQQELNPTPTSEDLYLTA
jgi:ATP-dependent Clp protease ATP-binding subunit ClpC